VECKKIIWLTGLSGSGKTTIGKELINSIGPAILLDGDDIRQRINNKDYSNAGVIKNINEMAVIALYESINYIPIVCCMSPLRLQRMQVRNRCGQGNFFEVYLSTPVDVCSMRDPKGIYQKRFIGQIKNLYGIDSAYQEGTYQKPELTIDTTNYTPAECAAIIIESYFKK
jgi:adenylylsulfate kinase-like enzyme